MVDVNGRAQLTFFLLGRALGIYLDSISAFLIISIYFLSFAVDADPLLIAFTLQMVNGIMGTFQFVARLSADI